MERLRQTFASRGALESGLRATAANPVMNITLRSGSISVARRASSIPSISGITMSVIKKREGLLPQALIGAGAVVKVADVIAGALERLTRNRRMSSSSSARRIRFIDPVRMIVPVDRLGGSSTASYMLATG